MKSIYGDPTYIIEITAEDMDILSNILEDFCDEFDASADEIRVIKKVLSQIEQPSGE